jgi:Na+-transporting methylmalonyl-CoA/oxaloacetate decarboxylase gamma subunit
MSPTSLSPTSRPARPVSGKAVVIAFLTTLILATAAIYVVVVQLKRGGAEALRENKERRVPEAAQATQPPAAPSPGSSP